MQTAMSANVGVSRGAVRPMAVAMPKSGPASVGKVPTRTSVVSKAAMEDVKTLSTNGSSSQTGAALDFDELTDLIKMVHETDIVELTLNSKKFKLSVKKKEALESMEPQIVHMQAPMAPQGYAPAPMAAPAPAPAAAAPAAAAPAARPAAPAAAAVDGLEIASPMAGTFYRSPAPGEPVFCKEGDRITKGQTIGIIEAMKLMNEIEAEVSGTVVKITAENGKSVTPGQALLIVRP